MASTSSSRKSGRMSRAKLSIDPPPCLFVSVHLRLQEPPRPPCSRSGEAVQPAHDRDDMAGTGSRPSTPAGAVGDAPAGQRDPAHTECRLARAGPRAGSPARAEFLQFLA